MNQSSLREVDIAIIDKLTKRMGFAICDVSQKVNLTIVSRFRRRGVLWVQGWVFGIIIVYRDRILGRFGQIGSDLRWETRFFRLGSKLAIAERYPFSEA